MSGALHDGSRESVKWVDSAREKICNARVYLRRVEISRIRSIDAVTWDLHDKHYKSEGWHVVLGTNGSGKSSFLRAAALALVGVSEAYALRQRWEDWLKKGEKTGLVQADLTYDPQYDLVRKGGRKLTNYLVPACISFNKESDEVMIRAQDLGVDPSRYLWGQSHGWFSAGYGPFRRFAGSDKDMEKLYLSNPILARHLTLFGEQVALTECIAWLQRLQFESLEAQSDHHANGGPSGRLLACLRDLVNQPGFLPHESKLERVSSSDVIFVDGNGARVSVEQLSDGFRSILSLTFELIRQLVVCYGVDKVFPAKDTLTINVPGVVFIDEIDAHLHPSWQREIGFYLTKFFPMMQFIVTTHSPLVCHAAARGSIFRLAKPGSGEASAHVVGAEYDRLVYGNVLDAYGTESFGRTTGGPSAARQKRARLAALNAKELEDGLSQAERKEQAELRAALPSASATTVAS
jgi:energy-coupling factor transporter ATP-binding protein EcfA2